MRTIRSIIPGALKLVIIMTILCGIIYPLAVTGISQLFFKDKANGSILEANGVKYGSTLLGQQYTSDKYLWGRIMNINTDTFTDKNGIPVMYADPSNKSTASTEYAALILERVEKIKQADPNADASQIPVDLVTCSGSGMDPHISVAAADYQVQRIADSRHIDVAKVQKIIDTYTTERLAGLLGERTVNVLQVNLALDGILK